jgi:hypothetical protein
MATQLTPLPVEEKRFDFIVEEKLKFFKMKGYAQVCEVEEHEGVETPTEIIRTGQNWSIKVWWETIGALNCLMCGYWKVRVYLEQFGAGEYDLPNNIIDVPFHSEPYSYHGEIKFNPGDLKAGVYKGVVTVQLYGSKGVPGPIVAFAELGWLHFYDSKPFVDVDHEHKS